LNSEIHLKHLKISHTCSHHLHYCYSLRHGQFGGLSSKFG